MARIEGTEALEIARTFDLRVSKYNDPIEEAREGLSHDEAEAVLDEDPSLIYIDISFETARAFAETLR